MEHTQRKEREIRIGNQVAQLLGLKFDEKGECKTTWGTKSYQGLGAVITRMVEAEVEQFGGKVVDTFPETMAYKMPTDPLTGTPLV